MSNLLANETSPYLLQHADNPVEWRPWGEEALAAARAQDKPIFLSIGYSACHWCHVMAHESFADPETARLLNESFISIKVDREERPELDQIYMEAVQRMTGHGGWPLSVFLTPELEPFFGGTYWPPEPRGGMPGFKQVIRAVADAWKHRRGDAVRQAKQLTELLGEPLVAGEAQPLARHHLEQAEAALSRSFDPVFGGFGGAPKFPHPIDLRFLLRRWFHTGKASVLTMVRTTLDKMAAGGMYDQLGGGFHRYSVDAQWLVPHFEKMLYDNALLARCYLEAWMATGEADYARVARETLDYVLRDLTDPAGGFYSSEDADSEGHEGRFYVWTAEEIRQALGSEAARVFCYVYDVTEAGNFEGRNILSRPKTLAQCARILGLGLDELTVIVEDGRRKLFEVRSRRVRPGRDDKVLTSWNGLMIDALALAGAALGEPRYLEAARRAAEFVLANMRQTDGRLWHAWRRGHAAVDGLLEDYASLAEALVTLYEADFDERWIDEAVALADLLLARFGDPKEGGFFTAAADHGSLLVRKKDLIDSSTPSGSGLAASALARLARLSGREDYRAAAEAALAVAAPIVDRMPLAVGQMLLVADMFLKPSPEVVIVGGEDSGANAEVIAALQRSYVPGRVAAFRGTGQRSPHRSRALEAIFQGKSANGDGPMLYLCENWACQAPVRGAAAVASALANLARQPG
jgi:uncharacterized protein YyaL (SSP411 family)